MNIPGHMAIALAQDQMLAALSQPHRRGKMRRALLLASLFPDMVDKTIGYVFHAMPNGRHYAHSVFGLFGFSALVSLGWGREVGLAWFTGYLGHLLVDSTRLVPWFFPLLAYPFPPGRLKFDLGQLARESLLLGLVLILRRISR